MSITPTSFPLQSKIVRFGNKCPSNGEKAPLQCRCGHQSAPEVDASQYLTPEQIEMDQSYGARSNISRLTETRVSRLVQLTKSVTLVLFPLELRDAYYFYKGVSLNLVKRYADAEKAFRNALEIHEGKKFKDCVSIRQTLRGLANACEKQGKTEEAQVIRNRLLSYETIRM